MKKISEENIADMAEAVSEKIREFDEGVYNVEICREIGDVGVFIVDIVINETVTDWGRYMMAEQSEKEFFVRAVTLFDNEGDLITPELDLRVFQRRLNYELNIY